MKKVSMILAALILVALCVGLMPIESKAAEIPSSGKCGDNVTFTYADGTLTISGTGPMTDFDYETRPPWDDPHCPVTKIIIEEGVTTIGEQAFNVCYWLEQVSIASSVTSIGKAAFASTQLKSIAIPDSVVTIERAAFQYCDQLESVTLGDGLKTIKDSAFYSCTSLADIAIPAGVTTIGSSAFDSCTSLTVIRVDPANTHYASDSYGVLFDKGMTTMIQMPGAFSGAYTVPFGVTTIGDRAGHNCADLTEVVIPEGVTSIGAYAFSHCDNLTKVSIPDSVTAIGETPFYFSDSLAYQAYGNAKYLGNDDNPYVILLEAMTKTALEYPIHAGTKFICDRAFEKCTAMTSIAIPDSVTHLGEWVFAECPALKNATIGNGVTNIRNNAFYRCTALETVKLGDKVTNIGEWAFSDCTALKTINFPNGLKTFEHLAFYGCVALTEITLPGSVTEMGKGPFVGCAGLTSVAYCGTAEQWQQIRATMGETGLENVPLKYHNFGQATCTMAAVCTACGTSSGEAAGHTPGPEATETTAQICVVCGEEIAPALGVPETEPSSAPEQSSEAATEPSSTPTGSSKPTTPPVSQSANASGEDAPKNTAVIWIAAASGVTVAGGAGAFVVLKKKNLLGKLFKKK